MVMEKKDHKQHKEEQHVKLERNDDELASFYYFLISHNYASRLPSLLSLSRHLVDVCAARAYYMAEGPGQVPPLTSKSCIISFLDLFFFQNQNNRQDTLTNTHTPQMFGSRCLLLAASSAFALTHHTSRAAFVASPAAALISASSSSSSSRPFTTKMSA